MDNLVTGYSDLYWNGSVGGCEKQLEIYLQSKKICLWNKWVELGEINQWSLGF